MKKLRFREVNEFALAHTAKWQGCNLNFSLAAMCCPLLPPTFLVPIERLEGTVGLGVEPPKAGSSWPYPGLSSMIEWTLIPSSLSMEI